MAKKENKEVKKEKEEKKEEVKKEMPEEKVSKTEQKKMTSAKVFNVKGVFVREYTDEMHTNKDKGFIDIAKGYAGKIGGSVKLA